jgi:hypothetical protein
MVGTPRARAVAALLDELLDEIELWTGSTRVLVVVNNSRLGGPDERELLDDLAARKLLEPFRDELLERAVARELIAHTFVDDHSRLFACSTCVDCGGSGINSEGSRCLCATLRPASIYLCARLITMDPARIIAQERIDRERMPHTQGHLYVDRMRGAVTSVALARAAATEHWVLRAYPAMIGVRWPRPVLPE